MGSYINSQDQKIKSTVNEINGYLSPADASSYSDVSAASADFVNQNELNTILSNYQKIGQYALYGNYVTQDMLKNVQPSGSYAPAGNYIIKDDLQQNYQPTNNYVNRNMMQNYAPAGNYALKSDLASYQQVGNYAPAGQYLKADDLMNYALLKDLNPTMTNLTYNNKNLITSTFNQNINSASVTFGLKETASKTLLPSGNYQPSGDYVLKPKYDYAFYNVEKQLQPKGDYAVGVDITNLQNNYATVNDLNSYQLNDNYVTESQYNNLNLTPAFNNFVQKSYLQDNYLPVGNYATSNNYPDASVLNNYMLYGDARNILINMNVNGVNFKQGPVGDQGNQGNSGLPGINGKNGKNGPEGDRGDVGPPGKNGTNGLNGRNGIQGNPGPVGNTGPRGDKGIPGVFKNYKNEQSLQLGNPAFNAISLSYNPSDINNSSININKNNDYTQGVVINGPVKINNVNGSMKNNGNLNVNNKLCLQDVCITSKDINNLNILTQLPPPPPQNHFINK